MSEQTRADASQGGHEEGLWDQPSQWGAECTGLLYREEARNTGSVPNEKTKVKMGLGEETSGLCKWTGALVFMRPPQSIGVGVAATEEMPETKGSQWGKQDVTTIGAPCLDFLCERSPLGEMAGPWPLAAAPSTPSAAIMPRAGSV